MKYNRVHPYTITEYLSRFTVLIIIPILQQLFLKPLGFLDELCTYSINIAIITILLVYSISEYKAKKYSIENNYIAVKYGCLIKRESIIPIDHVHSIIIKKLIIPSIFGAIKLKINVPSGKKRESDINLTVYRKSVENSIDEIFPRKKLESLYKASAMKIFLMSMSWSNSATGLLIASPFINKIGSVLGEEISERIYSTIDISMNLVAIGVPPLAATVAFIFLAGWLVSLFLQLLRYSNFKLKKSEGSIIINRGLIGTTKMIIDIESINSISIKQTLMMRCFKLYSAYINAIGSGKDKGDKSMLVAATSFENILQILNIISDLRFNSDKKISPPKRALKGYIWLPILNIILVIILSLALICLGVYISLIFIADIFLLIIIGWWLSIRIIAYYTSFISVEDNTVLLSSYKRLSLITTSMKLNKVQKIKISQNPLQKLSGLADVKIFIYSNRNEYFTIKKIPHTDVENLVESMENLQNI